MSDRRLTIYSEPYSSTGNIGENIQRLLGTPALDRLQTVIRESVQNISDAAKLGTGPELVIRIRTLTTEQKNALSELVFPDLPDEKQSKQRIRSFLKSDNPAVMEICDFGTTGLGGPTRADRVPEGDVPTDFIDFIRNVGTPRDTKHGGGTYGFGKISLYKASKCSTILVDSFPSGSGAEGRRLIGCHVGKAFDKPVDGMRKRYTGRHWWGNAADDGIVDPAIGADADRVATAIGFLPRDNKRTGTSIMILDLDTDGDTIDTTGRRIAEALLWHFWPRMMKTVPDDRRFNCTIEIDGVNLELPAPEEFPPLDLFCKAMTAARSGDGNDVRLIKSGSPKADIGILAVERGLRPPPTRLLPRELSIIPDLSHHIALMRPVELVVKYLEGSALPGENVQWAGVFLVNDQDKVERAFADSEPPAHDDWMPKNLPKSHGKTFVTVALRRLREAASQMGEVALGHLAADGEAPPLAKVAGKLGAAIEGAGGQGAGKRRSGPRAGGSKKQPRAKASRPVFDRLELDGESTVGIFLTDVTQDASRSGLILRAEAAISVEGGSLGDVGDTDLTPRVVSIGSADGRSAGSTDSLSLDGGDGAYEIRVSIPPDCAVTVDAQLLTEREE